MFECMGRVNGHIVRPTYGNQNSSGHKVTHLNTLNVYDTRVKLTIFGHEMVTFNTITLTSFKAKYIF